MAKKSVAGTVKDPTVKFTTLTVDGEEYKLAYSFNSLAVAEADAGCNLLMGLASFNNLSAVQLRGLLFAALLIAHPEITVDEAGSLIRIDTLLDVTRALGDAYSLSMPEQKKTEEPEKQAANEAS